MIEIFEISKIAEDYESADDFHDKYQTALAKSYDEYINNGHSWCWCLVGNIVESHEFGEEHEIRYGTKQFSHGTKVYLAPAQWGDGYENIVVIGLPRHRSKLIEVVTRSEYVENYRMKKVFKPEVLKKMCSSQRIWWGDTENDRIKIVSYLEHLAPKKAEIEKEKSNQ